MLKEKQSFQVNEIIKYPKISLVTTCYNHEKYIGKTIESVIAQNYPNLQYIVINDGSSDNSEEVIKKYSDSLYHFETLEGYRPGPVTALNKGFSLTDGEIMGWINSDDILLPKSLFVIAKVFQQLKEVEWLTGVASTINFRDEIVRVYPYKKSVYDYLNRDWSVIQQESTFWRRNLWNKIGGKLEEKSVWAFDTELWTRFFLQTEHYHLNSVIGAFRKGKQSRSSSDLDEFMEYTNIALKNMIEKAPINYIKLAKRYKFLKSYFRLILRNIPMNYLKKFQKLRIYNYKVINYDFNSDKWKISEESPFS